MESTLPWDVSMAVWQYGSMAVFVGEAVSVFEGEAVSVAEAASDAGAACPLLSPPQRFGHWKKKTVSSKFDEKKNHKK